MNRWTWSDCYAGARVITLVLDEDEAEAFLDEARRDGRAIAADTARGLPAPARSSAARTHPPADPADLEGWQTLGRKIDMLGPEAVPILPQPIKLNFREQAPDPNTTLERPHNPVQSAAPIAPLPRPLGSSPPMIPVKRRDPDLQAMVEAAIAAGKLTVCPPCKHSVEPGQMLPGEGNWKQRKAAKEMRMLAAERREDAI